MFRGVVLLAAVCAISNRVSAQVKVEEQVVGPLESVGFVVSPKGVHFAASTMQGSRFVLVVDGVEGPKFDGALEPPVFSPDGAHFAYYGRQGGDYVVILDGKELTRRPNPPHKQGFGSSALNFTPAGKHLFWVEETGKVMEQRLVIDGQAGPAGSLTMAVPAFSKDESRFVYVMRKFGSPSTNIMVINGKEVAYVGDNPTFSGDGKSIISFLDAQGKVSVMVDGKPLLSVPAGIASPMTVYGSFKSGIEKLVVARTGVQVAAIVRKPNGLAMLYLNDKPVPAVQEERILDVQLSPDGKRYAALCANHERGQYVVIDGKKGLEYPQIQNLMFTPDSSKAVYTTMAGLRHFVVVEDKENGPFNFISGKPIVGGQGNRVGFVATDAAGKSVTVVDGVALPPHGSPHGGDGFAFSSDGSHYAYLAGRLVVDGVEYTGGTALGFGTEARTGGGSFLFSPDGKYIAYVGSDSKGNWGVWVNDKLISRGPGLKARPAFTPDGQHLMWVAVSKEHTLFVDGAEVMRYGSSSLDATPGAWEMGSDGVYQFLAPADKLIKRYRVTPAANSGVATLLANAGQ